jgi:hypothetical protein
MVVRHRDAATEVAGQEAHHYGWQALPVERCAGAVMGPGRIAGTADETWRDVRQASPVASAAGRPWLPGVVRSAG